jgi:hypothetical protein
MSAATSSGLRPLIEQEARELAGGRRLARALKPDHHDLGDAGREVERRVDRPHQGFEFVLTDLDEMVARSNFLPPIAAPRDDLHHLAERLLLDLADETANDLEVDVGFEQRDADVAQGVVDVLFGQLPLALEAVLDGAKTLADRLEHRSVPVGGAATVEWPRRQAGPIGSGPIDGQGSVGVASFVVKARPAAIAPARGAAYDGAQSVTAGESSDGR